MDGSDNPRTFCVYWSRNGDTAYQTRHEVRACVWVNNSVPTLSASSKPVSGVLGDPHPEQDQSRR
ncbi:hypothetical protein [Arthrobacter methylotrophus]|uniref:hypothetical protein n=1 Tax=Arthrobacter methylotrophus TaxID=121291 RepID=UPI0031EF6F7E